MLRGNANTGTSSESSSQADPSGSLPPSPKSQDGMDCGNIDEPHAITRPSTSNSKAWSEPLIEYDHEPQATCFIPTTTPPLYTGQIPTFQTSDISSLVYTPSPFQQEQNGEHPNESYPDHTTLGETTTILYAGLMNGDGYGAQALSFPQYFETSVYPGGPPSPMAWPQVAPASEPYSVLESGLFFATQSGDAQSSAWHDLVTNLQVS
jgi:hypothetical protein